ncbi:hypothetical protein [Xylella fastidiosa]|uniref:hypothetical protein n=1 Tax=Xylella fastidiosa TaxID=2371 RepID=UPI0034DE60CE
MTSIISEQAQPQANQALSGTQKAPLFYWDGIKDDEGAELQRASYSLVAPYDPNRKRTAILYLQLLRKNRNVILAERKPITIPHHTSLPLLRQRQVSHDWHWIQQL